MKALRVEQALCKLETDKETKGIFYNSAGAIEGIFGRDKRGKEKLGKFAEFLWDALEEKEKRT